MGALRRKKTIWDSFCPRGVVLGLIFAGYVQLAIQSPYPIIVYSVANYRPHLSHFCANMKFSRSQLSHVLSVCIYLILNEEHFTFHLQYKHSGTFANRKYEELSQKMCDPLMVNPVVKMRPHPVAHPH